MWYQIKHYAVNVHTSWVIWGDVMVTCNVTLWYQIKRYGITAQT